MSQKGVVGPITFSRADILVFSQWFFAAPIGQIWPVQMLEELEMPSDTVDVLGESLDLLIAKLHKAATRRRRSTYDRFRLWSLSFDDARVGAYYLPKRVFSPTCDLVPLPADVLDAGRKLAMSMAELSVNRGGLPMPYARAMEIVERYEALPAFERNEHVGGQSVKQARTRIAAVNALMAQIREWGFESTVEQADIILVLFRKLPKSSS